MNRIGVCEIRLESGRGAAFWYDPDGGFGSAAERIQLDDVPDVVVPDRRELGGAPGVLAVTPTAGSVEVRSSEAGDNGLVRLVGLVRIAHALPLL